MCEYDIVVCDVVAQMMRFDSDVLSAACLADVIFHVSISHIIYVHRCGGCV